MRFEYEIRFIYISKREQVTKKVAAYIYIKQDNTHASFERSKIAIIPILTYICIQRAKHSRFKKKKTAHTESDNLKIKIKCLKYM